jgi:hypothetical protein
MKHMREAIIWLAIAATGCDAALADQPKQLRPKPADVDAKADRWLRALSASLGGTHAMRFDADHTLEVVTKDGEKLQFVARSRVSVQRPNKLRSDRVGAFANGALYYDGQTITIYGKRQDLYAQAAAPNTLDAAIDFARDSLGLEAPAADLLYADAYAGLMSDVASGRYIGNEPIGDRMCHHLAYRAGATDWQIWIEDSKRALPCRYTITSDDIAGEPEFSVEFSNWNVSPKLDAKEFEFTPPSSATKIDFLGFKPKEVIGRKP